MKKIYILLLLFLFSCSNQDSWNIKNESDLNISNSIWKNNEINNDAKTEIINDNIKKEKIVSKEEMLKLRKQEDEFMKWSINFCGNIEDKTEKDDCKLKMSLWINSKNWCEQLKWDSLYNKCIEIKKYIDKYKEIDEAKKYYEKYYK